MKKGAYVQFPRTVVKNSGENVCQGFAEIVSCLKEACNQNVKTILTVECYPGVNQHELLEGLQSLGAVLTIHSDDLAFEPEKIDALLEKDMMDSDPVFGIMTVRRLEDYFYNDKLEAARKEAEAVERGMVLIYGVGASLVHPGDVQVLADITRWEIQLRYRRGMSNWRTTKTDLPKLKKYKRGFFAEWRWADKVKEKLLPTMNF